MPRPLCDSLYLYGLHDPGGEQHMLDLGVPGWVLVTEAIGANPGDLSGRDYRHLADRDLGVLVRLNAGYAGTGTLPHERDHANFARRCANFVRASQGAHLWIVGNEPNHPIEWPGADWDWSAQPPRPKAEDKYGEPITPERYARCYLAVRDAIKALPGRAGDQVIVAAVAPWNALLQYPGNPLGDWVKYLQDVLASIGAGHCDGIALHTYTHGASPALIRSESRMSGEFQDRRFHFRAYQDFMAAIPAGMRDLPVYITETDQGDDPWRNENAGWVREAYAEIDAWNRANTQKIRCLILYRWPQVPGDRWGIEGKAGVIEDFRQALGARYRWDVAEDRPTVLLRKIRDLEREVDALRPALQGLPALVSQASELQRIGETLASTVDALGLEALCAEAAGIDEAIQRLEEQVIEVTSPPGQLASRPAGGGERGAMPRAGTRARPADDQADQSVEALKDRIRVLEAQVSALAERAARIPALEQQASTLQGTVQQQQAELKRLQEQLASCAGGRVARPAIVDMVDKLAKHPTLPAYEKRTRPISMIVVHHTDTRPDITVEQIAHYHVYGERKRPDGTVLKEQWPGVGYHFLVAPDGVIYQGQREETRSYHVGGDPNDFSVAISLIGRFMKTDLAGKAQPAEAQVPTPQQLRSAGHLAAWLMQEYGVAPNRVLGHRDVWPGATVCPGEHWRSGPKWRDLLEQEIVAAQKGRSARRMDHYLLFWDHGAVWAEGDWRNAQAYLAHFRTTAGFSVEDALLADNVTIVGGEAGVSAADEARLRAAGVAVRRLAGRDEAHTKELLDELVQKNTLWPGAAPRVQPARAGPALTDLEALPELHIIDEWSVPDDWQLPSEVRRIPEGERLRVKAPPPVAGAEGPEDERA